MCKWWKSKARFHCQRSYGQGACPSIYRMISYRRRWLRMGGKNVWYWVLYTFNGVWTIEEALHCVGDFSMSMLYVVLRLPSYNFLASFMWLELSVLFFCKTLWSSLYTDECVNGCCGCGGGGYCFPSFSLCFASRTILLFAYGVGDAEESGSFWLLLLC